MQILIFPSKSFLLKQELLVLAMVWILCRQTHEQAYVSAGKRLCLQASMQTSTWQEASSAAMASPQVSKSLVHSTGDPSNAGSGCSLLWNEALPATPSTEVLTIPHVTRRIQKPQKGQHA